MRDAASARGIPSFMAAKMLPWFLTLSLSIPPCASATIAQGGLDHLLMTRSGELSIPTQALEPWEAMFDLISGGTFEEQLDALSMGLIDPDQQDAFIDALLDLYFEERSAMGWHLSYYTKDFLPDAVAATFDAQMAEVQQALLIYRNANWIPVITQAAQTHDRIFIAFGAAHLFGEDGVLNLLDQDGWDISRF